MANTSLLLRRFFPESLFGSCQFSVLLSKEKEKKKKFSSALPVSRIVERPLLSEISACFSSRLVDRASDRAVWGWGNFEAKKRSESDREFFGSEWAEGEGFGRSSCRQPRWGEIDC